jgi:hypothetical protein
MTFIINIAVLPTIGHIHGSVMEVKISHGIVILGTIPNDTRIAI